MTHVAVSREVHFDVVRTCRQFLHAFPSQSAYQGYHIEDLEIFDSDYDESDIHQQQEGISLSVNKSVDEGEGGLFGVIKLGDQSTLVDVS